MIEGTNNLTIQDIDMLLEAVTAWERSEMDQKFTSMLIGMMTSPTEEARKKMGDDHIKQFEQMQKSVRAERAILMKAKLIQMKQSLAAEQLASA